MKSVRHSRLLRYAGLMLCVLVWLANNGNPPTGRTGAPFDGHCSDSGCHDDANPNGFDGTVSIEGLPGSIEPSTTYPLTITMTPTAGTPILGGFQLVVVDNINGNCGNLTAGNAQSGTEFFGGREYLEHRGGKTFGGNPISWTFNWASPATVPGNTVKFYFIGNFTNDNNNRSGDFPKDFFVTAPFSGPPPVTAAITNWTNVLCNGGNTGSATVEADGGVPPYTYLWNNGQTTATAVNLTAGTYTATVTGSSGSGTATASTIITQPSVLNLNTSVTGTITCATPQATATATATGGTPGYEYVWSNGDTGPTASFTEAGTFTVIATDANGCTKVGSVNIQQNLTAPTAVANSNTDITCSTPQVSLSGSGSSVGPTFSYLWTTVSGNIVSGATTLTPVVNLCATYTLVVTNTANGCTSAASTVVECQIDPPDVSAANNGPITCVQQNATLSGNSTVPGVIYTWSGPNGFNSTEQEVAVNTSGIYTLTVLNPANNCSNTTTTTVLQNTAVPTDTAHVSGPITCADDSSRIFMTTNINNGVFQWIGPNGYMSNRRVDTIAVPGDYIGIVTNPINGCKSRDTITVELNTTPPGASASSNGSITCTNSTVQLTGGPTGNNSYLWTGPNGFTSNLQNTSTNAPGTYNLVVTSLANGCSSSASTNIIQNTTQPTATIVQPGNLNCNNATLQLNGTGSSQGSNFSYLWTTLDGQILSGDTSLVPVIGAPGTYRLAVTNTSNGCTATASVAVNQSQPVSIATTSTNVSCNGGSNGVAAASGSGGNGVYNYLWSNGQTTATISGLTAGSYQVVVTDGESCTTTATVNIQQPPTLTANATSTGETALGANDGTASASPAGGTLGYNFNWSNGSTTPQISGLSPGSYTVSVTDANGCSAIETVTVNAFGCSLVSSIGSTNVSCFGASDGTASVIVGGATDPVTYNWSTGATTQQVSNLAPGAYTVSIVDGSNCPAVLTTTINEPAAISPNATATGETASGANNGTATANPTGGAGGYSYIWSNTQTTATISNLAPGNYTVSVYDANQCSAVQTVLVNSFDCAITATVSGGDVSCFGGSNGTATIAVSNGELPYSYLWSNGAITATASNLSAGVYTVVAADAAGCTLTQTVTIHQPDQLVLSVSVVQNVVCPSSPTGAATIDIDGGVQPYTISGNLTNLTAGNHVVMVIDANNCTVSETFTILATDSEAPVVNCPANIYVCGADFVTYPAVTATDNCGLQGAPVRIAGLASGAVFNDGTTTQVFQATDVNGNTGTCSFSVVVNPIPDILIDGATNDHNGQGTGSISITPVGGGGGYLFTWKKNGQFFSNEEDLTGLNAGSYSLVITDANGCTSALAPVVITNTVGVGEPGAKGSIRLWPNPTAFSFTMEIIDMEISRAFLLNIQGQLVRELDVSMLTTETRIDDLANGVYFLRMHTVEGKTVTLQLAKTE